MKRLLQITIVILPWCAAAQSHTTLHFSVDEGLPSSEVYEVYQDSFGFLWFATDNGVARYDGKEFRTFHVQDGLTDPVVFGFFEDKKKHIWFRTFSGRLCYFDGVSIREYAYNQQLKQNEGNGFFNFLYDSDAGVLRFTTGHVLGKIDANGEITTDEPHRPYFFIRSIDGQVLPAAGRRYSIKNVVIDNHVMSLHLTDTVGFKYFNAIAVGKDIYVSIFKDVFRYDGDGLQRILTGNNPVISLSKDRNNRLWVGYLNGGVERFDPKGKSWRPLLLRDKSVTKVFQDHTSGYWFSTLESGAYYIPNTSIENYRLPTSSKIRAVLPLNDTVLIADQKGALFFVDPKEKDVRSTRDYNKNLYGIFRDSQHHVWMSAGSKIVRFSPDFHQNTVHNRLVSTLFSEDTDGSIWALNGGQLAQFDLAGRLLRKVAPGSICRTMMVGDSLIYLAGRVGLQVRDKDMKLVAEPEALSALKITQIQALNDSTLLLATQGNGLVVVDERTWRYEQFNTGNQFPADNIYCLLRTGSTLWAGTDRGLIAADAEKLLRREARFHRMSLRMGLISNKINLLASVDDNIWAFGDDGFSVVPQSFAHTTDAAPIFYIKAILSDGDTVKADGQFPDRTIECSYANNNLNFTFGYISFANQDIFLRYRISPERHWIPTSERTIQLSSLAPDSYLFELQYSMDNMHWTQAFAGLPFIIESPWWMKWYTALASVLVLLLMGYLYLRHRQSIYKQKNHYLRIINDHQQKLIRAEIDTRENERQRIARELHDGVGTNLTAIKLMVNHLLQHHHEPRAKDIEDMFQTAIRELKDIIYGLTPPSLERYGLFTALRNYISRLNHSLTPTISLQVFGKEIKNYDFNIMIFRIVQELISNSIKHAAARHITIHVNAFEDMLNIIYEDDGVGFSPGGDQTGLGLANIESRLQALNGTIKFDSGSHGVSYTIDVPLDSIREYA